MVNESKYENTAHAGPARECHRNFLSSVNTSSRSLSTHLHPSCSLYQVWFSGEIILETRLAPATGTSRAFGRKRWVFTATLAIFGKGFQFLPLLTRDSRSLIESLEAVARQLKPSASSSLPNTLMVSVAMLTPVQSTGTGVSRDRGGGGSATGSRKFPVRSGMRVTRKGPSQGVSKGIERYELRRVYPLHLIRKCRAQPPLGPPEC